ncbi:MAG: hypothetical protein JJT96_15325 [Opitutales bacterium]|nr:hypothetical protein [Opitutales bacterium]
MKTIKTLIANDSRHLRSRLIVWMGLLLLPVLCIAGLHTSWGWSPDYWSGLSYALPLLFSAQLIAQAVLVANLVQKENLKNPEAYWLTRPIPRGQLATAKLISAVLWFLLPQLLQISLIALLLPAGLTLLLEDLGSAAIPFGAVLCATLVVAGLSRTSGAALLGLIAIPVGLATADIVGLYLIRVPLQSGLLRFFGDAFPVGSLLFGLVFLLSLGGFSLRYCAHRFRPASISCLGLAAACLVLTIGLEDPPRIPEPTMQLPDEATLHMNNFSFLRKHRRDSEFGFISSAQTVGPAAIWEEEGKGNSYGISANLHWSGLPEEWFVQTRALRTFGPDGKLWGRPDEDGPRSRHGEFSTDFKRSLFPEYDTGGRIFLAATRTQLFDSTNIDPAAIDWPVSLSTEFATQVFTATKERVPLAQGARIELHSTRLLIGQVQWSGNTATITFNFIGVPPIPGLDIVETGFFVLYDPSSGVASFSEHRESSPSDVFGLFQTGYFELNFRGLKTPQPNEFPFELYFVHLDLLGVDVRRVDYRVHRNSENSPEE